MSILPQFWTSDTSEVTKGLLGPIQNLHFTSVLGVRHVRSDERVARRAQKFAFYHSFERPTRPKWWKGRSATWKICVLPQFWTSDTSEVTKGSIGDVKNLRFTSVLSVRHARSDERVVKSTGAIPAPQTEKEYILTLFQTILISNLFSAVLFSCISDSHHFSRTFSSLFSSLSDSHHFSRTLGDVWWQSLKTAITSVELCAMFDDNLSGQPSLQ